MTPSPIALGPEWLDSSIRVLAAAFADDPTVGYICRPQRPGYATRVRDLYVALGRHHLAWSEPSLGIVDNGQLVAVCHLARPGARQRLSADLPLALRLLRWLGVGASLRGARFVRAIAVCHPETPHYYVVAIGVDPRLQGRGYGGALLRAVADLSARHPQSRGVALDTQKVANVPLYERFGYTVTRTDRIGPLDSWCLFRPNQVGGGGARVESRHEPAATEPR